jgi:hypothetical protein
MATGIQTVSGEIQAQPINDNNSYLNERKNDLGINIKDYGGVGDGTTGNYSAITSAIAAMPSQKRVLYFPSNSGDNSFFISTDFTFTADITLYFESGAKLKWTGIVTFDKSRIIATPIQIFECTGGAGGDVVAPAIYPEWFGAVGDGATDDLLSFQIAKGIADYSQIVLQPKTDYAISAKFDLADNRMVGDKSIITLLNDTDGIEWKQDGYVEGIRVNAYDVNGYSSRCFVYRITATSQSQFMYKNIDAFQQVVNPTDPTNTGTGLYITNKATDASTGSDTYMAYNVGEGFIANGGYYGIRIDPAESGAGYMQGNVFSNSNLACVVTIEEENTNCRGNVFPGTLFQFTTDGNTAVVTATIRGSYGGSYGWDQVGAHLGPQDETFISGRFDPVAFSVTNAQKRVRITGPYLDVVDGLCKTAWGWPLDIRNDLSTATGKGYYEFLDYCEGEQLNAKWKLNNVTQSTLGVSDTRLNHGITLSQTTYYVPGWIYIYNLFMNIARTPRMLATIRNRQGAASSNISNSSYYIGYSSLAYFPKSFVAADVNTANDTINVATTIPTGTRSQFQASTTLPTPLDEWTDYFINNDSATTTVKVYDTYANAVAGGATGLVDFTDIGSGNMYLIPYNDGFYTEIAHSAGTTGSAYAVTIQGENKTRELIPQLSDGVSDIPCYYGSKVTTELFVEDTSTIRFFVSVENFDQTLSYGNQNYYNRNTTAGGYKEITTTIPSSTTVLYPTLWYRAVNAAANIGDRALCFFNLKSRYVG